MKRTTRTISTLLIAVILIQMGHLRTSLADVPNPVPTPPPSNLASDADGACAEYRAFSTSRGGGTGQKMSLKYVQQACGLPPGVLSEKEGSAQLINQGIDDNYKSNDPDWESCFHSLKSRWGILAQYCGATDLADKSANYLLASSIAYTSAAIACCAEAAATTWWTAGIELSSICTGVSGAATVADTWAQIRISESSNQLQDEMSDWQNYGLRLGVGVVGAAGTLATALHTDYVWNWPTKPEERHNWLAWAACGAHTLTASVRWYNYNSLQSFNDQYNRKTLNELLGSSPTITANTGAKPGSSSAGGLLNGSGNSGNTNSLSDSKKAGNQSSVANTLSDNMSLASPQFSAATTGIGSEFFKRLANKDRIPSILKQKLGVGLTDIARKLEAGQSPASIISSLPGMEKMKGPLDELEKRGLAIAAAASQSGTGAYASRGGAGSGGSKAGGMDFGAMFGAKDAGMGAGGSSAIAFEKMKQALAVGSSSEDIYHETYKGSIFDIATQRLDKSRKNVDELEWESPMNRALLGLPKRLTTGAGASKTTLVK